MSTEKLKTTSISYKTFGNQGFLVFLQFYDKKIEVILVELEELKKKNIIFKGLYMRGGRKIKQYWLDKQENDWRLVITYEDLKTIEISQVFI